MIALLLATAWAGEMFTPGQLAARADTLVEIALPLTQALPKSWPNQAYDPQGAAFPSALIDAAWGTATITPLWPPDAAPPIDHAHIFSSGSACWWAAHDRGRVRALVFLDASGRQVVGTEGEWGRMSDLNPDYDRLKAALVQAMSWTDERMNAMDPSALWQAQRAALDSGDPYRQVVASDWLSAHGASDVITDAWGAHGTPGRQEREASATLPSDRDICR